MKRISGYCVIALSCFLAMALSGCCGLKEAARGIAGTSTKVLEDGRATAIKRSFNYDPDTCYMKTQGLLKQIKAYIYAKDKQMIAIYVSDTDTTPVGIFFIGRGSGVTEIEVSSPSSYAKEQIAAKVFSNLGKSAMLDEVEGKVEGKIK